MIVTAESGYHSIKSCFGTLTGSSLLVKDTLTHYKCQSVDGNVFYLSASIHKTDSADNRLFLNGLLANQLGVKENQQISLSEENEISECLKLWLSPLSTDDYEILEFNKDFVEESLLHQLQIVYQGLRFPLWIENSVCLFLQVDSFEPSTDGCVQLTNLTEVFVSPTVTKAIKNCERQSQAHNGVETSGKTIRSTLASWFSYDSSAIKVSKAKVMEDLQSQLDREALIEVFQEDWRFKLRVQSVCTELEEHLQEDLHCCCPEKNISAKFCCCSLRSQPSTLFAWRKDVSKVTSSSSSFLCNLIVEVNKEEISKTVESASDKPEMKKTTLVTIGYSVRIFPVNENWSSDCEKCQKWTKALKRKLLEGHVLIHNNLRRQFGIPKFTYVSFGPICLDNVSYNDVSLKVFPSEKLPDQFQNRNIFNSKICPKWPLVVSNGALHSFKLDQEELDFVVTIEGRENGFCFLTPDLMPYVKLDVANLSSLPTSLPKPHAKCGEFDFVPFGKNRHYFLSAEKLLAECIQFAKLKLVCSPLSKDLGDIWGHMLLCGSLGHGKTSIAECLCNELANWPILAYSVKVECPKIKGKKPENLSRHMLEVLQKAADHQPSVIFMDDLDSLCCNPTSMEQLIPGADLTYTGITKVIIEYLEHIRLRNWRVMIVATARSTTSINAELHRANRSYFSFIREIGPFDLPQRKIILTSLLKRYGTDLRENDQLDIQEVTKLTDGFVPADLERLVKNAINQSLDRHVTSEDFHKVLNGFKTLNLHNVHLLKPAEFQCTTWNRIGGLTECKRIVQQVLLWPSKYPELFRNSPIRLAQGILLYGYPGTGKTMMAGAAAKECGLNFIVVKGPELLSKYIGASEQAVRDTFLSFRAKIAKPCLVFFDEFDALAPRRGHDSTGVTDRVVNQLLTELDGVEGLEGVFIIAATSRPDLIDPALLRPGRVDKCVRCELPDQMERLEILKCQSEDMKFGIDVSLDKIVAETEYFSGADLKALLHNAQLEAVHEYLAEAKRDGLQKIEDNRESIKLSSVNVTFYPTLVEGNVELTESKKEMLTEKLSYVLHKERSISTKIPAKRVGVMVNQSHISAAILKTKVSLSDKERERFKMSFENFEQSRKGDSQPLISTVGTKATLA